MKVWIFFAFCLVVVAVEVDAEDDKVFRVPFPYEGQGLVNIFSIFGLRPKFSRPWQTTQSLTAGTTSDFGIGGNLVFTLESPQSKYK